ncbi:MAG: hypothetical protein ACRD1P_11385, partial [Thermoanaerobaculia bacterium]
MLRRPGHFGRLKAGVRFLSIAWLVAGAAAACSRRPTVFPRAPVVVIVIDTLRADHLPVYG